MSRLYFKGGAWTNAEDQVLQAALAQYGLRDWERVASMLSKKTAAQCRERWESFLDPRLSIQEAWSIEEEERLVQLQTLFPNKWRLIAEEVGRSTTTHHIRPAWLCEQRYLEIRDAFAYETQHKEGDGSAPTQTMDDFMAERRRRRAAYHAHEEKAARADTVDGERFEKEMIDMAVSRLANQDQKKGLRKERQRQLGEASFLAKLESNREGIESGTLSARQEKRMRKALEDDRRTETAARQRREDGSSAQASEDEVEEGFHPVDMLEDQAAAGIQRRSRTLLVDLAAQQSQAQEASAVGGVGADGRLLRTGVNVELLEQATAGVLAGSMQGRLASTAAPAATMTWDSLAGPNTAAPDLDDLFATLPDVVETKSASGGEPHAPRADGGALTSCSESVLPPPLRPIEPSSTIAPATSVPERTAVVGATDDVPAEMQTLSRPTAVVRVAVGYHTSPMDMVEDAATGTTPRQWRQQLEAARRRVAVEAERTFVCEHRRQQQSSPSWDGMGPGAEGNDETVQPDADAMATARSMIQAALHPARLEQDLEAVQAAQEASQMWTTVNTASALGQLEEDVHGAVAAVNARLEAANARVEKWTAVCFPVSDPWTPLAGRLPASGASAVYAQQYWTSQLERVQQQVDFTLRLRAMEHDHMRRQLAAVDGVQAELVVEERRLQLEYRELRRANVAGGPPPSTAVLCDTHP